MHIKQLEISGFKSFVDRTVIHFDHDVIGVVGPNGCGKSNIVDAIRWCMGEQSAKHLRGRAMADVIFSGSESRAPVGMAEVTITFDNSDAELAMQLPIEYRDYSEIAVTRRLYRDGTSEYLVNKTQVRLKDITDLFLGTGVGTKAYSIVEQGKIGLIVSARPEDRRLLIEEAAGITKYKHRRRQAEQKMDLTRQNLARVGDIVAEIERNLASLRRQAAKAERYKSYHKELEELMLHEASHRFLEITVVTQVESGALAQVSESAEATRAELGAREGELEASRMAVYELEQRAETAQSASFAATNEVRSLESEIARSRDRLGTLDTRSRQAVGERDELAAQIGSLAEERIALSERLAEMEATEQDEAEISLTSHEKLEELREEESAASRAANEVRARASSAAAKVAAAEAKLSGFSRRVSEMQSRKERLVLDTDGLRSEREELDARRTGLATQLAELVEGKQLSAEQKVRIEEELKGLREELVTVERELDVAKNELSQKRNRLRALEELHKRLEGVGTGTKHLLSSGDETIVGMVADLVEAPKDLTQALAGLLGDRLQHVVVRDISRGLALLASLATAKKGRAGVLPQNPPLVVGSLPAMHGEGIVGRLVDRLGYAPENASLVRSLVGDAVLVETVEHALALSAQSLGRPLVCLDGTVLFGDGRVVGGSGDAVAAGMIEQVREIRELNDVVTSKGAEVSEMVTRHQTLRNRTAELGAALDRARNEAHQSELAHVTTEKDLRRTEDQLAASLRRLDSLSTELGDLEDRLAEAADEESDARVALEEGQSELDEAQGAVEGAESIANGWRERVAAQLSLVTEHKVRLARMREQAAGVRGTVERLGRSVEELSSRIARLDDELVELAGQTGKTAATLMMAREQLDAAVTVAQAAESELGEARRVFDEARQALAERESGLKELRTAATELAERRTHHDKQVTRLSMELTHLLEGVAEKFRGLDLRKIIGDYHAKPPVDDEHRARIGELGQLLDRMGPVNLDAVREHEEAEGRFTFYSTQKADLEGAIADLERAIEQMDRESRKLFRDTFDSVNEKFQTLFPRMFRGGAAKLSLTNPEDLLETGVEILAQPPGKKLGNIELMSGGEKALTAVSLIFAMFQHKPSPFCILDEVDAPLDEANVARYNEAIRSMTDKSQFILITHIKRTMQSVDVLYGVTMQEPGVSKLVSVKINDAAVRRSAPPETVAVALPHLREPAVHDELPPAAVVRGPGLGAAVGAREPHARVVAARGGRCPPGHVLQPLDRHDALDREDGAIDRHEPALDETPIEGNGRRKEPGRGRKRLRRPERELILLLGLATRAHRRTREQRGRIDRDERGALLGEVAAVGGEHADAIFAEVRRELGEEHRQRLGRSRDVARQIELDAQRARDLRGDDADTTGRSAERELLDARTDRAQEIGGAGERDREIEADVDPRRDTGERRHRDVEGDLEIDRAGRLCPALEPRGEARDETAQREEERLRPTNRLVPRHVLVDGLGRNERRERSAIVTVEQREHVGGRAAEPRSDRLARLPTEVVDREHAGLDQPRAILVAQRQRLHRERPERRAIGPGGDHGARLLRVERDGARDPRSTRDGAADVVAERANALEQLGEERVLAPREVRGPGHVDEDRVRHHHRRDRPEGEGHLGDAPERGRELGRRDAPHVEVADERARRGDRLPGEHAQTTRAERHGVERSGRLDGLVGGRDHDRERRVERERSRHTDGALARERGDLAGEIRQCEREKPHRRSPGECCGSRPPGRAAPCRSVRRAARAAERRARRASRRAAGEDAPPRCA